MGASGIPRFSPRTAVLASLAAAMVLFSTSSGQRAAAAGPVTRTWVGTGANNSWTLDANWNPGAPQPGDILVFPTFALRKANSNNYPAGTSFKEIRFTGNAYALSGNRVVVAERVSNDSAGGTNTLSLVLDGTAALENKAGTLNLMAANSHSGTTHVQGGTVYAGNSFAFGEIGADVEAIGGVVSLGPGVSIANHLVIGAAGEARLHASADAQWVGTIELALNTKIDVAEGATLGLPNTISGAGHVAKTGPGTVVLGGANTHTNFTDVYEGTLAVTNAGALGATAKGTYVDPGATLQLAGVAIPAEEDVGIEGNGSAGNGALRVNGGTATVAGLLIGDDGATIRVDAGTLNLPQGLHPDGTVDVRKTGAGTLLVGGQSTFNAALAIEGGEVSLRGDFDGTAVIDGGKLTGDGSPWAIQGSAGILEPGVDGDGTMDVREDLFLGGAMELRLTVEDDVMSSGLRVAGTVELVDPKLVLSGAGSIATGQAFTLIQNDGPIPIQGTFASLSEGASVIRGGKSFSVSYEGGDEPGNDAVLIRSGEPISTSVGFLAIPNSYPKGAEFAVTFFANNLGPGDAEDVELTIPVIGGFVVAGFEAPAGWQCLVPADGTAGVISCTRDTWAPTGPIAGAVFKVTYEVTGSPGAQYLIDITLTHGGDELLDDDNTKRHVLTVSQVPRPFVLRGAVVARDGLN